MIAGVLLALILSPTQVSGASVAADAKSLLAALGAPAPLRLQGLGTITQDREVKGWSVKITDGRHRVYEGYCTPAGRLHNLRRADAPRFLSSKQKPLTDPRLLARALGWVRKVKGAETIGDPEAQSNSSATAYTFFPILRNGYQFVVSWQRFGYSFTFSTQDAEILAYEAKENPPPVDATEPRLSEAAALAAVDRIWKKEIIPKAQKERGWRVWYELHGARKLGYFLPKGERKARLVWLVPYSSMRDVGHAIQGGGSGMLIDAVTGHQVRTDYSL